MNLTRVLVDGTLKNCMRSRSVMTMQITPTQNKAVLRTLSSSSVIGQQLLKQHYTHGFYGNVILPKSQQKQLERHQSLILSKDFATNAPNTPGRSASASTATATNARIPSTASNATKPSTATNATSQSTATNARSPSTATNATSQSTTANVTSPSTATNQTNPSTDNASPAYASTNKALTDNASTINATTNNASTASVNDTSSSVNDAIASAIKNSSTKVTSTTTIQKPIKLKSSVKAATAKPLPHIEEIPIDESPSTNIPLRVVRTARKKRLAVDDLSALGFLNVNGYTTAEEYNLEALYIALKEQKLYEPQRFFSTETLSSEQNVLYVTANYKVGEEPREIFFFREGSVVFWNCDETEANNMLSFLHMFEREPYVNALVHGESEMMPYSYITTSAVDVEGDLIAESNYKVSRAFFQNGKFFITSDENNFFYKYTFSNAIAQSIKLGMWESTLDRYIDSMEYITEDLKRGRRLRISRAEVLRKTGELFALRHVINLSSDLLDSPDFYWDREELEQLYLQVCSYFNINRRTKVMNEKISHCSELAELVSHNLNDAHHIRLEWMIIILIMVEVAFEVLHFINRHKESTQNERLHVRDLNTVVHS